jgi:hypothetical protein
METTMRDYKISELIALGRNAAAYCEETLGYTSAELFDVTLYDSGENTIYLSLFDDFQKELFHDNKYKVGGTISFDLETIWDDLRAWPNREQRELEILARRLAALDANLDQVKSAQVRAFIARLQPEIDKMRAMITHQSRISEHPEIDDNEIPF